MRQQWLYFCYRFYASVVNSLTLSSTYIGCHSVFIDDFKVYSDSVFTDDLWISRDISFLTIPSVSHDSIFAIDLMPRSWIQWLSIPYVRCPSIFIDDFKVYSYSVFSGDLRISCDITFLTIPCVSQDSSFAIDLMRRSSIHIWCRFHISGVTQFSVMISMSTETQFSLTIYGSGVT